MKATVAEIGKFDRLAALELRKALYSSGRFRGAKTNSRTHSQDKRSAR